MPKLFMTRHKLHGTLDLTVHTGSQLQAPQHPPPRQSPRQDPDHHDAYLEVRLLQGEGWVGGGGGGVAWILRDCGGVTPPWGC